MPFSGDQSFMPKTPLSELLNFRCFPKHSPPPIMMWGNRYSSSCVVSFNLRCFPEGTKAPVRPVDVSLALSHVKGSKIFFFYKTVCRASLAILKGRYCLFHLTHASAMYDSNPARSWSWCEVWLMALALLWGVRTYDPHLLLLNCCNTTHWPSWFLFEFS